MAGGLREVVRRELRPAISEEVTGLRRENERLRAELAKAATIIEGKKKLSLLLGHDLMEAPSSGGRSS
jgi:hypothetical protein